MSVHFDILTQVKNCIQALTLNGLDVANVKVVKIPWATRIFGEERSLTYPGILISPLGVEAMNATAGTNASDDVGYPVLVSIFAADQQDFEANLEDYLKWRETIARAFRNQRLDGVSGVYTCIVEPGQVMQPEAFVRNTWQSTLTLRFFSRETRGAI